jgi:hypothetical protein
MAEFQKVTARLMRSPQVTFNHMRNSASHRKGLPYYHTKLSDWLWAAHQEIWAEGKHIDAFIGAAAEVISQLRTPNRSDNCLSWPPQSVHLCNISFYLK